MARFKFFPAAFSELIGVPEYFTDLSLHQIEIFEFIGILYKIVLIFTVMKALKITLIILGSLMILMNLLALIANSNLKPDNPDPAYSLGYSIGRFLIMAIGIVLLGVAYRINRKMKRKKEMGQVDSFLKD